MFAAIAHLATLLRIARTFARHDALFPLEHIGVSPVIVAIARGVSRRAAPGRPGERLAAALEELGRRAEAFDALAAARWLQSNNGATHGGGAHGSDEEQRLLNQWESLLGVE